jgi:hypothetical protein
MANMLDYLDWRGDLTLAERPFGEVDNLLLAELSYLDFGGVAPEAFGSGVSLREASALYFQAHLKTVMGVLVPNSIPELARRMGESARFADVRLSGYVNYIDEQTEVQFSAVCFALPNGRVYAAFRGTDDTLVGWKEDFNLGLLDTIPSQAAAVGYLQAAAKAFPDRKLLVGGHSKGGNLAVYAAVFCGEDTQSHIETVYNNDGPGFRKKLVDLPEHRRIEERIVTLVPESSVVGMLLEHEESYEIVRSTQVGIMQHDGFSWVVKGDRFVHVAEASLNGRILDGALSEFVHNMDAEQRVKFVDALFAVLTCTDAETLTDLKEGGFKTASAMAKAVQNLDKDSRRALLGTLSLLVRSNVKSAQEGLHPIEWLKNRHPIEAVINWLDNWAENKMRETAEPVPKS